MFDVPDADLLTELMTAKVVTVNRCISSLHAYTSQADRQSIRAAETPVGHVRMRHSATAGVSVTVEDFVRMDQTTDQGKDKSLAAKDFLNSFWCKRVVLLMRAMHPWVTMQFVSLFRSHVVPWQVRASLIILKLVSAACANALFFTSSAVAADADMGCGPLETAGERLLRAAIVGILSACMGDLLIVLLAMVQRRQAPSPPQTLAVTQAARLRKALIVLYPPTQSNPVQTQSEPVHTQSYPVQTLVASSRLGIGKTPGPDPAMDGRGQRGAAQENRKKAPESSME
ncbi:rngB [Symbiodinium natans]|uniref:RngB protein n=1 Tax=Symbiodinium natans TaxID=878477 RepID=A0A812IJP8_9DINO|nr:rngB [Symbiodinium natans]